MSNIQFYDCMPAMADVSSGQRPRPEPLPDSGIMEHIVGYIAAERIEELGARVIVLAEKDQEPSWFAGEIDGIREWEPGSPIIHAGGHLVGFNSDATRLTVLQLPPNSRERTEFIKYHARLVLDESGDDVTEPVKPLPLAKKLMAITGCGIDAAKRRIADEVRQKRGQAVKRAAWGGKREGSGRPGVEDA